MKRRWIILLVVLVLVAVGFFLLMPSGSYRRELEAYKQGLKARGEKITYAELIPSRPGRMSQSAVMYMAITTNLSLGTNLPMRFSSGQTNLTPAERADYNTNIQLVAQLRAALAAGPLDFNLDYSLGWELPLPAIARFKRSVQIAAGTTAQALASKDYPEAWADLLVTVDLVRMQESELVLISDIVRAVDLNIALPVTRDALDEKVWTDTQLADLQARWDGMNLFTNAEPNLAMEIVMTADTMQQARSDFAKLWELSGAYSGSAQVFNPPRGRVAREFYALAMRIKTYGWRNTWSYDEELRQLQILFATKETARKAMKSGAFVPAFNELIAEHVNINDKHSNTIRHFLLYMPGGDSQFSRYLSRLADAEVQRRLAVTAIALERFKLAKGKYPERLEELMPEFLKSVPMDFMDGMPLRYRLRPDGDYLLYSVGSGGKDDGGNGDDNIWPRPSVKAKE